MRILTHKVVKDGEILGYRVDGGAKPYCVSSDNLLSNELFNLFMDNGYTYFGKIEFEDDSETNITELPELNFDSLSDFERADFFETKDVMAKEDLLEYITKRGDETPFEWKPPGAYLINTREELLAHIKTSIVFDASDPKTYMPLNSYTNPAALFTEKEFADPENHSVMNVIANRRYYNLYSLFKMNDELEIAGFDPIDFIDAYFAWGIDGLKTTIISKDTVEIDQPLYVRDNFPTEGFSRSGLAYVKKDLSLTPPLKPGWFAASGNEKLAETAAGIYDERHGVLISTKSPATVKCIRYEFAEFSVEITPDFMKFKMPKDEFLVKTIRFLTPSGQYLPSYLWNLALDENKDEIMHLLKVESMAKYLAVALKCKTDYTSMKVYQTIGLTKPRAADTILNIYRDILFSGDGALKEEYRKSMTDGQSEIFDEEEISALSMQIGMVKDVYMYEETVPENLEVLYGLCKKVDQGEINIDSVLNGIKFDNSVRLDDIIQHIDAAVKILGLSYNEVFGIIERDADNVSGDGVITFRFEGNGIINEFYIPRQNLTAIGFQKDLRSERSRLAAGARYWLFLREIYTEPGQACARHLAVRVFAWPHYLADRAGNFVRAAEERIISQINAQLESYGINLGNDIYQLAARYVCEFGLLGKTQTSLKIDESVSVAIEVEPEVRRRIQDTFEQKFETTFNISNYMFKSGEPIFFVVNAIITPYWVVPLGKQRIPAYPLYLAWHFGKEKGAAEQYEALKAKGFIPDTANFYSLKYLMKNYKEETQLIDKPLDGFGLSDYCYEYFTDPKLHIQKPVHPADKYYLMLSHAEDDYLKKDDFSDGLKHKMLYYAAFCHSDEADKVIDVSGLDYTGELYDLLVGGNDKPADDSFVTVFTGFINEDILDVDNLDAFREIFCADMGEVHLKGHTKDTLFFTDDTACRYSDVPKLNRGHYAVRRINERMYLLYYGSGKIIRVDL